LFYFLSARIKNRLWTAERRSFSEASNIERASVRGRFVLRNSAHKKSRPEIASMRRIGEFAPVIGGLTPVIGDLASFIGG